MITDNLDDNHFSLLQLNYLSDDEYNSDENESEYNSDEDESEYNSDDDESEYIPDEDESDVDVDSDDNTVISEYKNICDYSDYDADLDYDSDTTDIYTHKIPRQYNCCCSMNKCMRNKYDNYIKNLKNCGLELINQTCHSNANFIMSFIINSYKTDDTSLQRYMNKQVRKYIIAMIKSDYGLCRTKVFKSDSLKNTYKDMCDYFNIK